MALLNKLNQENNNIIKIDDYEIYLPSQELKSTRVVFMGTPLFAVPILEMLMEKTNVVLVVTQKSKKKDRKGNIIDSEVKIAADEKNIEVYQPENIKEEYDYIISKEPDIIITCAYGQIIPKKLLDYPQYGCINVHASLLPDLRGGAPIHWAIIKGYTHTGITVMDMSEKMDAGDIISQREVSIDESDNLTSLYKKLSIVAKELIEDTLPSIIDGSATRTKQNSSLVTYGYNISSQDEKIDFNKNAEDIRNLVRGLSETPAAYCYLDNKRLKIYDISIQDHTTSKNTLNGTITSVTTDGIICTCADGLLKIKDIKIEGKKRCLVKDYLNGINKKELIGKVLK